MSFSYHVTASENVWLVRRERGNRRCTSVESLQSGKIEVDQSVKRSCTVSWSVSWKLNINYFSNSSLVQSNNNPGHYKWDHYVSLSADFRFFCTSIFYIWLFTSQWELFKALMWPAFSKRTMQHAVYGIHRFILLLFSRSIIYSIKLSKNSEKWSSQLKTEKLFT